jgi:hypothetical protein
MDKKPCSAPIIYPSPSLLYRTRTPYHAAIPTHDLSSQLGTASPHATNSRAPTTPANATAIANANAHFYPEDCVFERRTCQLTSAYLSKAHTSPRSCVCISLSRSRTHTHTHTHTNTHTHHTHTHTHTQNPSSHTHPFPTPGFGFHSSFHERAFPFSPG